MNTTEDTTTVYKKSVSDNVVKDLTANSDNLSTFQVGENKVKILFSVE